MTRKEALKVIIAFVENYACGSDLDGLKEAIEVLKEQRPHGEWIPCSDRLPEEDEDVLGWIERDCWKDGYDEPIRVQECVIGWHIEGRWHFDGYNGSTKCIAWMPLPEPYKEEGESN